MFSVFVKILQRYAAQMLTALMNPTKITRGHFAITKFVVDVVMLSGLVMEVSVPSDVLLLISSILTAYFHIMTTVLYLLMQSRKCAFLTSCGHSCMDFTILYML